MLQNNSAREGTDHWIGQRLSALGTLFLGLPTFLWILAHYDCTYHQLRADIASFPMSFILVAFISFANYHGLLGVQMVVEDYLHQKSLKVILLTKFRLLQYLIPLYIIFLFIQFRTSLG